MSIQVEAPPVADASPATRVLGIALRLHSIEQDISTRDAWARALGIPDDAPDRTAWMLSGLSAFHREVDRMFRAVSAKRLDESLFPGVRSALLTIADPGQSNVGWRGLRGHLSDSTLLALRWAATTVDCDEAALTDDDVQALLQEAINYRAELPSLGFSEQLLAVLLTAVERMISALRAYRIEGAHALKSAMHELHGAVREHETELAKAASAESPTREPTRRFAELVAWLGTRIDATEKWAKRGNTVGGWMKWLSETELGKALGSEIFKRLLGG